MRDGPDFESQIGRIDELVHQLETGADSELRATARELVGLVMELNAAGFERILALVSTTSGSALLEALLADDLLSSLLILYGLHPEDCEARVHRVVSKFHSVQILGIEGGILRVRAPRDANIAGNLRIALSAAAPEIVELIILEPPGADFVPVTALTGGDARVPL